jgi:hypothetical protein
MANGIASSASLINCTFSGNAATATLGGAIYNYNGSRSPSSSSSVTLTNCILWGDSGPVGSETYGSEIYNLNSSTSVETFCDIQGGLAGTGNIDADPQFVDAAAGNLELQPTSPCVNVGSNAAIEVTGVTPDLAGNPRIFDGVVDMGAYEAQSVTITWTGNDDGVSWSDPGNWSDNLVPTQNDSILIPAGFPVIQVGGGAFSAGVVTGSSPIEILPTGTLQLFGPAVINGSLTIDTGGTLDIQTNNLTINYGSAANDPINTIRGYLHSAYAGGAWSGTGLTSSVAVAHPNSFAIGYADNAAADQLTYQLTIPGDATLDGSTNFNDLLVIAQHFGQSVAKGFAVSWTTGDVNYDGNVNFNDLLIVAQHFGDTLAKAEAGLTLPASKPAAATTAVTAQSKTVAGVAVIQPASTQAIAPAPSVASATAPTPASSVLNVQDQPRNRRLFNRRHRILD